MFETQNFKNTLEEDIFDTWLQKGRESRMGYQYMLIVWLVMEEEYKPIYLVNKKDIDQVVDVSNITEVPVAAYDLYSESKVSLS